MTLKLMRQASAHVAHTPAAAHRKQQRARVLITHTSSVILSRKLEARWGEGLGGE